MTGQLPPEGWYEDGVSFEVERWWDGQKWTELTRPIGGTAAAASGGGLMDKM